MVNIALKSGVFVSKWASLKKWDEYQDGHQITFSIADFVVNSNFFLG